MIGVILAMGVSAGVVAIAFGGIAVGVDALGLPQEALVVGALALAAATVVGLIWWGGRLSKDKDRF